MQEETKPILNGDKVERNEDGTIKSGVLNPNGRPKGSYSLKTLIEKKLKENPDIEEKLINDLLEREQSLVYQMIDGKPRQNIGIDGGEDGVPLGVVILPKKDESPLEATT